MEYKLVIHAHRDEFVRLINEWMEQGWSLHGETRWGGPGYYQAMVRHQLCQDKPKKNNV